jgi:hypothetical protein
VLPAVHDVCTVRESVEASMIKQKTFARAAGFVHKRTSTQQLDDFHVDYLFTLLFLGRDGGRKHSLHSRRESFIVADLDMHGSPSFWEAGSIGLHPHQNELPDLDPHPIKKLDSDLDPHQRQNSGTAWQRLKK